MIQSPAAALAALQSGPRFLEPAHHSRQGSGGASRGHSRLRNVKLGGLKLAARTDKCFLASGCASQVLAASASLVGSDVRGWHLVMWQGHQGTLLRQKLGRCAPTGTARVLDKGDGASRSRPSSDQYTAAAAASTEPPQERNCATSHFLRLFHTLPGHRHHPHHSETVATTYASSPL